MSPDTHTIHEYIHCQVCGEYFVVFDSVLDPLGTAEYRVSFEEINAFVLAGHCRISRQTVCKGCARERWDGHV